MTFEQGAVTVISTLALVVVPTLFGLYVRSNNQRVRAVESDLRATKVDLQECKDDRERIWERLRDTPNPDYCPSKACPFRDQRTHITFSSQPTQQQ